MLLLSALYVLNCLFFSEWLQLADVPARPWLLMAWLYGLILLVPLVWRDVAPVTVFAIEVVLTAAAWPVMPFFTPVTGIPLALYAVTVQRSRRISLAALLASFVPNGLCAAVALRAEVDVSGRVGQFLSNIVILSIVSLWVWGMGRVARASRLHVQRLEHERETARNAVAEERGRIARELHDIVSHAVTVIVLQAAGAQRITNSHPSRVVQSLRHIEATGMQAMTELRRLLGVLKAGGLNPPSLQDNELEPQLGLKDLATLLDSLRDAGMRISVCTDGEAQSPAPSLGLAAYRVVQEGLTNVLKHSGGNPDAQLRLVWERHRLSIEIYNDLSPSRGQDGEGLSVGAGLVGLRERVDLAGGSLCAGPCGDDGYRLVATLPITDREQRLACMDDTHHDCA